MNRRDFLELGAATSIPLLLGMNLTANAGVSARATPLGVPLQRIVYDSRYADSVAFATEARRLGLQTAAIEGDVTRLWYDDLYHLWRSGAAAIAGMTTRDALFCLETLGNDAGLRLVMRADHRFGDQCIEHRLLAPIGVLNSSALDGAGEAWSLSMARWITTCPAATKSELREEVVTAKTEPARGGRVELISWVMAPVKRRARIMS